MSITDFNQFKLQKNFGDMIEAGLELEDTINKTTVELEIMQNDLYRKIHQALELMLEKCGKVDTIHYLCEMDISSSTVYVALGEEIANEYEEYYKQKTGRYAKI